jgi:hypothetical protein
MFSFKREFRVKNKVLQAMKRLRVMRLLWVSRKRALKTVLRRDKY